MTIPDVIAVLVAPNRTSTSPAAASCGQVPDRLLGPVLLNCPNISQSHDPGCFHAVYECSINSPQCASCLRDALVLTASGANVTANLPLLLKGDHCVNPGAWTVDPTGPSGLELLDAVGDTCVENPCEQALYNCWSSTANCSNNMRVVPIIDDHGQSIGTVAYNGANLLAMGTEPLFEDVIRGCAAHPGDGVTFATSDGADPRQCSLAVAACVADGACWQCVRNFTAANAGLGDLAVTSDAVASWTNCSAPARPATDLYADVIGACDVQTTDATNTTQLTPSGTCFERMLNCTANANATGCGACAGVLAETITVQEPRTRFGAIFGVLEASPECRNQIPDADAGRIGPTPLSSVGVDCTAAGASSSASLGLYARNISCQLSVLTCDNSEACRQCLAYSPTATHATVQYTPACGLLIAPMRLACDGVNPGYVRYLSCPGAVQTNNTMAYVTSMLGAVSIVAVQRPRHPLCTRLPSLAAPAPAPAVPCRVARIALPCAMLSR